MKFRIFRMNILLLVTLSGLLACNDGQANDGFELAGDVLVFALPIAATGLTIGHKDGQGAWEFGESAALSMGVAYALKLTVDKKRPNGGDQSFTSGHATLSFASAEFVRKRYRWEYGLPAYVLATFVAYSRVEAKQHYAIDVISGAAIGMASSYLFTQPYKGWDIQPEVGSSCFGIRFCHSW